MVEAAQFRRLEAAALTFLFLKVCLTSLNDFYCSMFQWSLLLASKSVVVVVDSETFSLCAGTTRFPTRDAKINRLYNTSRIRILVVV